MKQVVVQLWCDPHLVLEDQQVDGKTVTVDYGQGAVEFEVCGCEEDRTLRELRKVVEEVGRIPQQVPKPKQKRKYTTTYYDSIRGEYHCQFCGQQFDLPHITAMHEFRNHCWQRLLWERDTDYMKQHNVGPKQRQNRQTRLNLLTKYNVSLERAAELERQHGGKVPVPNQDNPQNREILLQKLLKFGQQLP